MEMAAALWQQLGGRRFLQLGAGGAAVAAWSWQQCNRARAVAAATAEERCHINESAAPGCECLATLLKGTLPVHDCHVLCCY